MEYVRLHNYGLGTPNSCMESIVLYSTCINNFNTTLTIYEKKCMLHIYKGSFVGISLYAYPRDRFEDKSKRLCPRFVCSFIFLSMSI
jgi:hypothetical protein